MNTLALPALITWVRPKAKINANKVKDGHLWQRSTKQMALFLSGQALYLQRQREVSDLITSCPDWAS